MYPEQPCPAARATFMSWPLADITKHDSQFVTAWGAGNLVANPELKTSVESLVARGPGTLSGMPAHIQLVAGSATDERGVWSVQLSRRMSFSDGDHTGERIFQKGDYLPVRLRSRTAAQAIVTEKRTSAFGKSS